jgi:hypothetical protein
VSVTGSAELRSVITIRGGAAEAVGETDANGQFNVTVTLQPDRINKLLVYATGKEGKGLTSPPAAKEVSADFDPPTITVTATPTPNRMGWNNTNVTVTFTCADALSGVAACPPPFLVAQEGANQIVQGTATDIAGNSSTASINISIDKTAPNIGYAIAPPPNANGWYTGDVIVTFTCSDALSGIDICPGVLRPAGDGVAITVRGTASDRAGNSAVSVAQLNVDRAPPSVVIQLPASGSVVNAASVQVSGTVVDATSGLASIACNNAAAIVSGATFSCNVALHEGANTINVTAVDRAGLMSTAGISVFMTPAAVAHVSVEQPPSGTTLTTPFQVWGWAIDPRATIGTGVDQVNVWAVRKGASANAQAATPVLLGTATYGLDRPDIRRALGDRFAPSGYAFTVRGLAPGDYMLQVSARSTVTGAFDNVSTTSVKIPKASGGDDGGMHRTSACLTTRTCRTAGGKATYPTTRSPARPGNRSAWRRSRSNSTTPAAAFASATRLM